VHPETVGDGVLSNGVQRPALRGENLTVEVVDLVDQAGHCCIGADSAGGQGVVPHLHGTLGGLD
jgi:hypothetical protein